MPIDCADSGSPPQVKVHDTTGVTWQMWKLEFEGPPRPSPETSGQGLPSYEGLATGQSSTHTQHAESEHDDFRTVTVVTTTVITTRKKSRAEAT